MARNSSRQSVESRENVFYGTTLKEAYRQVEARYGKNVIIVGSRKITRRQEKGLGQEQLIEVTVQPPGSPGSVPRRPGASAASGPVATTAGAPDPRTEQAAEAVAEIAREVERIESLVREATEMAGSREPASLLEGNPLAEILMASGAEATAVQTLFTRFASETGEAISDRPAALSWLHDNLKASNCGWDGFFGCHAFLGDAGCGRTRMVLGAAAQLRAQGRKTLVLSLHPAHAGEIRRLQNAAASLGFDAAILRKDSQLARTEEHLTRYEAVLLDLPALDHPSLKGGGRIHDWLARNPSFHRHLVVPLDRDLRDIGQLRAAARAWNCDWLAVSRMDRTGLMGKLLDLAETIPLPYSLCGESRGAEELLTIAESGKLLDRILNAGSGRTDNDFIPGAFARRENGQ